MALISFVSNYDDMSTDKGYQFRFKCDKCGNGYMTQYKTSKMGMAQSILNAAGGLFGNYSASNAAYEMQRAVGGKAHDAALAEGVEEVRPNFRQCTKCGRWVCHQVCWNPNTNQCEDCSPDFQEHLAANQAQAKVDAARQQVWDKAQATNYVADVDMGADSYVGAPTALTNTEPVRATCPGCGAITGTAKFCPECGQAVKSGPKTCSQCGCVSTAKFCPDCGNKL